MPENQNIEWKETWHDEYLKWICGFANAAGGQLYIGCDDKGDIVGVDDSKSLLEMIPNKVRDSMGIVVNVNLLNKDGKEYIEIDVPSYPVGISCKGVYHYRSGSTKQILTGPALETFLLGKRGATWDNMPMPAFSMDDVDMDNVELFRKLASKKGRIQAELLEEEKEVLVEKLHLTNGGFLTNAAMLLFSKDPEAYQLGAFLKIGFFENDADLMYQDEVHGSLLEQVDKAVELIYFKYMKAKISYQGMQRIERYFVPEDALREALLNAICHKQYQSGIPVQISVYEDKLYVANIGSLPDNWTGESLMQKHASNPYNPNIASVLYLAGFIESWGRGIEKICNACKAGEVPMPEYTVNPGDIMIKFSAPEWFVEKNPDRVTEKVIDRVTEKVIDRVTEKVIDRVTEKVTDEVTDIENRLVDLLKEQPKITMPQLAEALGVSRKTVGKYLKKLKEKSLIGRVGSDRKGYWVVVNEITLRRD